MSATPDFWRKVTLPARTQQIHTWMSKLYGVRPWPSSSSSYWCPGPRPTPLSRDNLKKILSEPYLVAEKSDGLRMHLLLGKYSDDTPFAVLMDNKGVAYELLVFAPKVYFDGSLFDGELVVRRGLNTWSLLVFDVVALAGKCYRAENFVNRHKQLQRVFPMYSMFVDDGDGGVDGSDDVDADGLGIGGGGGGGGGGDDGVRDKTKKLRDNAASGMIVHAGGTMNEKEWKKRDKDREERVSKSRINFVVKNMLSFSRFDTLVRANQELSHETDGFIFTPVNAPVRVGTHPTCFKWKYEPSVDVRIVAHSPVDIDIFVDDRGTDVLVTKAMPTRDFRFQITGQCALMPGQPIIVECNVHRDKNDKNVYNLMYHRLRPDRTSPNSVSTFRAVMTEVDDEITMDELERIAHDAMF